MIRGTTAQFKFRLPYNCSELESAKIVFWQTGNAGPSANRPLPITKILDHCALTEVPNELCVTLTQEETLRFVDDRKAYTQLRAVTHEGVSIASKVQLITVYPVYDDTIIGDNFIPTPDYDGLVILDGETVTQEGG